MLNSKSKYLILLLSSVVVMYAIIGGMLGRVSAQNGSYQQLSIFTEVLNRIQNDYVDDPSLREAVQGAIRGLIESVDPYGGYLSPQDIAFYRGYDAYNTPGIGVVLSKRGGYPVVVSAIPDGPAAKAGLVPGDIIESIDALTTREMNLVQVHGMLARSPGRPLSLSVIRRQSLEPEIVRINSGTVQVPPIESRMVEGNIAYLGIPYLAPGKAEEARRLLDNLLEEGAAAVLLDLRYSAGGEENEAVELANLFLENGTIGYVEGQKFERRDLTATARKLVTNTPLVILANQSTAGAAEIVVGAIADNRRGEIVGVKTFGMAAIQRLMTLEDGWGVLMSVAKYYTPSGQEIQAEGLRPSVEVFQPGEERVDPNSEDLIESQGREQSSEDRQLLEGIEILKSKV